MHLWHNCTQTSLIGEGLTKGLDVWECVFGGRAAFTTIGHLMFHEISKWKPNQTCTYNRDGALKPWQHTRKTKPHNCRWATTVIAFFQTKHTQSTLHAITMTCKKDWILKQQHPLKSDISLYCDRFPKANRECKPGLDLVDKLIA